MRQELQHQRGYLVILLILVALCPASRAANDTDTVMLYNLLNERLALMPEVARYKFENDLPIADQAREDRVLANARTVAALAGLEPGSVDALFRAQISAAKAVQKRYLRILAEQPPADTTSVDLEEKLRPTLIQVGNDTVSAIARLLALGQEPSVEDWPAFQQALDASYVTDEEKKHLFDSLLLVKASHYPPPGFVDVQTLIPDLALDLRYLGDDNFLGRPVAGYLGERLLLSREAATALKAVQEELMAFSLGLKAFDGYRPQQAVDSFVRWAEDLDDQAMKARFYPDVDKANLFKEGYIAARSSHTRGSTVDLTIISLAPADAGRELDMGSPFDFFGPVSWPMEEDIAPQARAHRMLLRTLMRKHGFEPYPKEWWHFTLKNEPYPDTYFNFPIR